MRWVEIKNNEDLPEDGEYIVKTQTRAKWNVLRVSLHTSHEKGKVKRHWTCKNQEVTHYLDETVQEVIPERKRSWFNKLIWRLREKESF